MTHYSTYPADICKALTNSWQAHELPPQRLPARAATERLIDTIYQASLLREEGEPVQCRVMVAAPSDFAEELAAGDSALHVLQFSEPQPCTPHQLRKLAGAAGYYRSVLAVEIDENHLAQIWGILVTGTDWVNRIDGESSGKSRLPPHLVIQCVGPGHLLAAAGESRVLESAGGRLLTEGFDPFRSQWLPQRFESIRTLLLTELEQQGAFDGRTRMCESFVKDVAQSIVRRMLRLVRSRGHGGMLVYLEEGAADTAQLDQWLRFRVLFQHDDAALRFRRLMLNLMRRAREVGEARGYEVVTYPDYQQMQDSELSHLHGALLEYGQFLADLMSVDGSLVLDRHFRLIGFGAEILGDSPVETVHRALDLEAEQALAERADSGGTRHRSAYRLVSGLPETIAVVVSQDGDVRFVADHRKRLTYWPYLP